MEKVNLTKALKQLYGAGPEIAVVDVPLLTYLMHDGAGDPNVAPEYGRAVEALYSVAYGLKFLSKNALGRDYVVPPLEGLWWARDWASFTTRRDKATWEWTMLSLVPDWLGPDAYAEVLATLARKKPELELGGVRLERYHEGLSAQVLHIGAYDDEGPLLARLHEEWLPAHGYVERGKHHEIYLSDPRRTASAKLKTILRQPIAPKA